MREIFVVAKSKHGALITLKRAKEKGLMDKIICHSLEAALRKKKKLYRPAEWKDYKVFKILGEKSFEALS
jgi:hypothetical protein